MKSKEYFEYRNRWDNNPIDYTVGDFPIHLDIETITSCNLKCKICYQSFNPPSYRVMDDLMYFKILEEAKRYKLNSIKMQFRNEPLMDRRLPDFIRRAKDIGIIEVSINTNATLLDPSMASNIIKSGLDKIICSIDGHTKKIYESIRKGAKFDLVYNNIEYLSDLKKSLNSETPEIVLRTIKRKDININKYTELWKGIADDVTSYYCMDLEQSEDFNTYPQFTCKELWRRLVILADGTILPCCNGAIGNTIYCQLGNINDTTIHDVWTSNKLNELRNIHKNKESNKILMCRKCDSGDKYHYS